MKHSQLITVTFIGVAITALLACSDVRREPGKVYVPDMGDSRAYETYAPTDNLKENGINYNGAPVPGTVKRGDIAHFALLKDATGDSANYVASKQVSNPLPALNANDMAEAQRLYNVNCGVCHGEKLDGNGPLWKGGDGPYPAKPATLVGDAKYEAMPEGQMMYSLTYGKNLMGSYASQLSTRQRWMVIHYVKSKQAEAKGGGTPAADSAAVAVK